MRNCAPGWPNTVGNALLITRRKRAPPESPMQFFPPDVRAVDSRFSRLCLPMSIGLGLLLAAYLVIFSPGYLLSNEDLELLIFLQILAAAMWRFQARFFPCLIVVFLGAGT